MVTKNTRKVQEKRVQLRLFDLRSQSRHQSNLGEVECWQMEGCARGVEAGLRNCFFYSGNHVKCLNFCDVIVVVYINLLLHADHRPPA